MGDRALYQSLRADLELGDLDSAANVLTQIEKNFAGGPAQNSALLFGESWAELRSASGARDQFTRIAQQYPDSPLNPQVALAVVRTYELEKNWPAVITNYAGWLVNFPTNVLRPQVAYALAQANYSAGNETDALTLFTNFIAQFPTNALAPAAQWWVADHFFRTGDWANAERNYKAIFQNAVWQNSSLIWEAQRMAGQSALARLGYQDAKEYFTGLFADTNCPPALAMAARFAYGSALMLMNSSNTNNPMENFQSATNIFGQIAQASSTMNGLRRR
ncbi:MAG: tetratricopeptide repeat protein [Limisphaerales bacterium]